MKNDDVIGTLSVGGGTISEETVTWRGIFSDPYGKYPTAGSLYVKIGFKDSYNEWTEFYDDFYVNVIGGPEPERPTIEIVKVTGAADPFLHIDMKVENLEKPDTLQINSY